MTSKNDSISNKVNAEDFKRLNPDAKILTMADEFMPPIGKTEEEALHSFINRMEDISPSKTFSIKQFSSIAAAILIFIFVGWQFFPVIKGVKELKTANATFTEMTLPDGSNVVLNADSKINWNNKKFASDRKLTLRGEAFFDVKKGDEFVVETEHGLVEVLGTQLNIFSRGENFWVSCVEGKVQVSTKESQFVISPGEFVELVGSELLKSRSERIENTVLWKTGVFRFEEASLGVIFDELERQFDVSISFNGNRKRVVRVEFSNKDLIEALELVTIPMGLNYEIKNRKISITKKE